MATILTDGRHHNYIYGLTTILANKPKPLTNKYTCASAPRGLSAHSGSRAGVIMKLKTY